jgi:hypothetical protein
MILVYLERMENIKSRIKQLLFDDQKIFEEEIKKEMEKRVKRSSEELERQKTIKEKKISEIKSLLSYYFYCSIAIIDFLRSALCSNVLLCFLRFSVFLLIESVTIFVFCCIVFMNLGIFLDRLILLISGI